MKLQTQLLLQQSMQAFSGGNFDEAESIVRMVLQNDIKSADAILQLGIAYAKSSRFEEAVTVFCCLQPYSNMDARIPYNLGLIYSLQGRHQMALEAYDLALTINPDDIESLINKGATYNDVKNYALALKVLERAIQIKSDIPEAWSNKGIALSNLNLYQESLSAYNEAIKLNPYYFEAWSNKGIALSNLNLYQESLSAYNEAIKLNPSYCDAWSNKGNTLYSLKFYEEAITHYDQALSLKPDYAEAWSNKANALNELKRYEEAITHYEQALSLKPDIDWVYGNLLHTKMIICNWSGLSDCLKEISKKVMNNERVSQPFPLLALNDDPLLHRKCAEVYIQSNHPINCLLGPIPKRHVNQKIRVGYFSADFHNHATGYLMAELFELHDKNQFELFGFSFGPIKIDEMRRRLKNSFTQFIEVGNISNIEIAQLSRSLNIDIAVDLKGFTQDSRTEIFAYRAAPIQVNYLGYPGTMGADYFDYIIADKTLIPPHFQYYYSENIVYLPNSYQVNDRKRVISDRQFTRRELGLPETGFVFCCFNNNFKILPDTFAIWMRILNSVEGSVLWLFEENYWAVKDLQIEALNYGVSEDRLIFSGRMTLPEHLARHCQADLFLDTWPYNAHTTASDALWAGVPVLTLMGKSFASRVAASLLNAVGLPELITNTQEEYETLAIELATNPKKLADIKQKLAVNRFTTPLFDTPLFTKNLEAAYIQMHDRYQVGLQPDHIQILN